MVGVTAFSASVLGLLLVALSLNVIRLRRQQGVGLGDGGHDTLLRATRAQANLAEYAPMALLLLACLEFHGGPLWLTVVCAGVVVLGRMMHPLGILRAESPWQYRVFGTVFTLTGLIMLAVANLGLLGVRWFGA